MPSPVDRRRVGLRRYGKASESCKARDADARGGYDLRNQDSYNSPRDPFAYADCDARETQGH